MEKKNIGIWIRVSTEDQARGDSPLHHEKRARMYAEVKEWNVVKVYHLEGVSGKVVLQHPEAQRMLNDICNGEITGLIFSKLARLARNTRELLDISDYFREYDADLISLQESVDTSTPSGRLFYTMIGAMAQWEREEIASRVKASVPIRAKLGKRIGGAEPLGYKWVDNKLEINEEEAPLRKLIYELYAKEKRKKTVAKILNDRGYRTKLGNLFSSQTITKIISDPLSKGLRRSNYSSKVNGKRVIKPQEEWIFVKAPAIISETLWEECNRIMDKNTIRRNHPTKKRKHLFTKYIRCGCGGKMYVPSYPKYVCIDCRNRIPKEDMEYIFHAQLKNFLFSQKDIDNYLITAKERVYDKEQELQALKKKEGSLRTELNNVIRLNTRGVLSDEDFPEHYNPVSVQLKQVRTTMAGAQGELDALNSYLRDNDYVLGEARDLHSKWKGLGFEDKKSIIDMIVKEIIVGKEDIEINLRYSPPAIPVRSTLLKDGKRGNHPQR